MSRGLKYDKTWIAYQNWMVINSENRKMAREVDFAEAWDMLDDTVKLSLQPFILCKIVDAVIVAYEKGQRVERYSKKQMEG